jgi:hypothetical protein
VTAPALIITLDESRGVALVKGRAAEEALFRVAPETFQWSESGRGWVVALNVADDLTAWGQQARELVVVHRRRLP